jgi:hypothetical protein
MKTILRGNDMSIDTAKIWAILRVSSPITLVFISATLTYNAFFKPMSQITPLVVKLGALSLTVLTVYIISTILDITDDMKKSRESIDSLNKNMELLNSVTYNISNEIYNKNQTTTEVIENFSRFYEILENCREKAKRRLQLTQLDPQPPSYYGDPKRQAYFDIDTFVKYAKEHPEVKIQRIISVPTLEKLEWVRELIEKSRNINNIYIAYIRFEKDIRKYWPTPPILSVQVIDEDELLMDNPQHSYMPHRFAPCLYMRDQQAVKLYSEYYDELWKSLEKSEDINRGFVLKDGMDMNGYEEKLKIIESLIV